MNSIKIEINLSRDIVGIVNKYLDCSFGNLKKIWLNPNIIKLIIGILNY